MSTEKLSGHEVRLLDRSSMAARLHNRRPRNVATVKTVLVVDDDLGFLFWLGKTLENAGYSVVPAGSVTEAQSLLSRLSVAPDLLIINPALSDSGEFIAVLRHDQTGLRVMAAVEGNMAEASRIPLSVDQLEQKPAGLLGTEGSMLGSPHGLEVEERLAVARAEWLLTIQMVLERRTSRAN